MAANVESIRKVELGPLAAGEFGRDLSAGERVIGAGRPKLGLMLRGSDALMVPFSLMWGGGVIFIQISAIRIGAPAFAVAAGIPFVLAGLCIMFGRSIADAMRRRRTHYGVTDQRILIVADGLAGGGNRSVTSLDLGKTSDIRLSERRNGSGTIAFGTRQLLLWWGGAVWPDRSRMSPCFEAIADARDVYQGIHELRQLYRERGAGRAAGAGGE